MDGKKRFKYELPENCPESFINAKQLNEGEYGIAYFRIAKEAPPNEEDFVPQFFQARYNVRVEKLKKENDYPGLCQMISASLLKTEHDAIRLIKKFKKLGNYIFRGMVAKTDGLIVVSPSRDFPSHCSFFVYTGVDESRILSTGIYT